MLKKITATISLLILVALLAPYSFAKAPVPADECPKVQASNSSGLYVILEEPLGGPDALYCFRVCDLKPASEGPETMNKCVIKGDCSKVTDFTKQSCQRIQVIHADSGANLIFIYVRMIYLWAAGTIGIVSVFTLVYSGIGISMAGGDSGKIDPFKQRIAQSLMGLVVLFLSGLILYTINPTFFV
jgi:hypothetical protein